MSQLPKRMPHACEGMVLAVGDPRLAFDYSPRVREYFIGRKERDDTVVQLIAFCPFCGCELPVSLRNEFADRMEDRGLEFFDDPPPELDSDEWWWDPKNHEGG